jgi:glycosyltransferase involved in cell wall biosynthesis
LREFALLGQDPGFGGGVGTMTEELRRAAETAAFEPELHYLRYPSLDRDRRDSLVRGRSVSPVVPGLDVANIVVASARIARRIRDARARFVCAAVASHGYGAALAGKPYGCWVATSLSEEWRARRHGIGAPRRVVRSASGPGLRWLERTTLRNATVRWTISRSARRAVAEVAGLPEEAIRVVPIPVDTERFAPLPDEEWDTILSAPELVFLGRADDPRKNVGLLLDAFRLLRPRLPDCRLKLVGTRPAGPLPAGVTATGPLPSVAGVLRRSSLLVLPSLQEGFGIVVAEALASGVPVLVTPCGGPEDLVRSSGGGEVTTGFDPEELADRAAALLADSARVHELRRRGREFLVREHNRAHLDAALAEALEELDSR